MEQFVPYLLIACTMTAFGLCLYYWKESRGLYHLLLESSQKHSEMKGRLEEALDKTRDSHHQMKKALESKEAVQKKWDESKELILDLKNQVQEGAKNLQYQTEKLEAQKNHLEKELGKKTQALDVLEEEKIRTVEELSSLKDKLARSEHDVRTWKQKFQILEESSKRDLETYQPYVEARAQLKTLELEKKTLEEKAKAFDPKTLLGLRRRIAQYDRLYNGIKGLREMADERNSNWEVALKKLSLYVHQKENPGVPPPDQLGPLVGGALQRIGVNLVEDEHSFKPQQGSSPSTRSAKPEARTTTTPKTNEGVI